MDWDQIALQWLRDFGDHGIFTTDSELIIRTWNPWMERHSGRAADSVIGRNLVEVYPDIASRGLDRFYRQALSGHPMILAQRLHRYLIPMPPTHPEAGFSHMQQSAQIAPLVKDDQIIGTITVIEDVTERTAQENELRRQITALNTLREINHAILTLDLPECLRRIAHHTASLLQAPIAAVVLREDGELQAKACTCRLEGEAPSEGEACSRLLRVDEEDSVAAWVVRTGQSVLVQDTDEAPEGPLPLAAKTRCIIAAPLVVEDEVLGALVVESPTPRAFDEDDRQLLDALAMEAAIAVQNAKLHSALQTERDLLRTLIDNMPDLIYVKDRESRYLLANVALARWFGVDHPRKLLGKTDFDFYPQELAKRYFNDEQEIIRTGHPLINWEEPSVDAAGNERYLSSTRVPLRDAAGKIIGIVGICRDITEQKEATEKLRRHAAYMDNLNAIIAAATVTTDLRDLLESALDHTLRALDLKQGAIWVAEQPDSPTYMCVTRDFSYEVVSELRLAMTWTIQEEETFIPEPLAIEDWQKVEEPWTPLVPVMESAGARASLAVPIVAHGQHIGGICLASPEPRKWSDEEVTLVQAVGQQIGAAAQRLWLLDETTTLAELLRQLALISDNINHALAREETLTAIGEGALALSKADRLALYTCTADGAIECPWSYNLSSEHIAQITDPRERQRVNRLLWEKTPLLVPDTSQLPESSFISQRAQEEGFRAVAIWPLIYEERLIGAIACYYDAPHECSPAEREVMDAFADQAAIALENSRLYTSLQEANEQLREALKAKDEMVQNVSHELRTPLTMIRGYAELLKDGFLGELSPEQKQAIEVLYYNSERLRFMVDRLIRLQTLDPSTFVKIKLNPAVWLEDALRGWRERIEEAGMTLAVDVPPTLPSIEADPGLLNEVMDNLLDNAIKFSPEGGQIRISAWQEGDELIIAVSDQGIGIPSDKLERIFERFYQVDGSMTRRFGGMGIGLALCKEIIEGHGGRIWAESEEGQGSTFYIALPIAPENA
ncbi:MAG TPA: GAF domain-containing protein [Caldilineae bacterium]|nr:GAF domain-containing protein [Caldilineae bacterium]